jgi:hypothetical protein
LDLRKLVVETHGNPSRGSNADAPVWLRLNGDAR